MLRRRRGWASVALPLVVILFAESAPALAQSPNGGGAVTTASVDRIKQALAQPERAKFDQDQPEPLPYFPERPYWTKRKVAIWTGFAGAGVAAMMAWMRDRELSDLKSEIEALPPGSNDEWAELRDEADTVMKARNFWMAAAIGVGGVTAAYAIALRTYEIPIVRRPRGSTPGARRSTLGVQPGLRGLALRWRF